jgi:hypothetical protein
MIYTCYEMVRDCRANRGEGWRYFLSEYVPVIRKLLAHYYPGGDGGLLERVLAAIRNPESGMFDSLDPAPERWFVAELRQKVLRELPEETPEIELDLETVAEALAPLTAVEKQASWTETMWYAPEEAGAMLRVAPATVVKMRERAAELLRGRSDVWRRSILRDNGRRLGRAAASAGGTECLPSKAFLDVLDGRTTWQAREQMERHAAGCLHCVDHFCRMAETIELLRGSRPLGAAEAAEHAKRLGVAAEEKKGWRRLMGA